MLEKFNPNELRGTRSQTNIARKIYNDPPAGNTRSQKRPQYEFTMEGDKKRRGGSSREVNETRRRKELEDSIRRQGEELT